MAAEPDCCLFIQFAREPVIGRVKTRLMPHLSAREACELHCQLVRHTASTLVCAALGPVRLAVAGDTTNALFTQLQGVDEVVGQSGTDLGERMFDALERGLCEYPKVILVGSDCPAMDRTYLADAMRALDSRPVVLGPARDGGYVLIGVSQVSARLFEGISWGGSDVLAATRQRLQETGLEWSELAVLDDIDRPEDLAELGDLQTG